MTSPEARAQAEARQAQLTKPRGSLGRLESLAIWLASCQARAIPKVDSVECVIFAADHGVTHRGVSAFPQEVTAQMAHNFLNGGAACSVLAREHECRLTVVDMGIASGPLPQIPNSNDTWIAAGTRDFVIHSAMTTKQCQRALDIGRNQAIERQADLLIAGEMGIGNTSSASAIAVKLLGGSLSNWVGRGTGISDSVLNAKIEIIKKAIDRVESVDPETVLSELGGFEIAAMVGFYLGCCESNTPFLVDGWISTIAALIACRINPHTVDYFEVAHGSVEHGHGKLCEILGKRPLLNLDMRLGEASGALAALSIVKQACALHSGMATFAEASVSGKV